MNMLIGQMRCNARNSEHVFRPGDNTWKATSLKLLIHAGHNIELKVFVNYYSRPKTWLYWD